MAVEFFTTRGREETDIIAESFFTVAVIASDGSFAEEGPEETERTFALAGDDGFLKPSTEESVVQGAKRLAVEQGAERLAVDLPCLLTIAEGHSMIVA